MTLFLQSSLKEGYRKGTEIADAAIKLIDHVCMIRGFNKSDFFTSMELSSEHNSPSFSSFTWRGHVYEKATRTKSIYQNASYVQYKQSSLESGRKEDEKNTDYLVMQCRFYNAKPTRSMLYIDA